MVLQFVVSVVEIRFFDKCRQLRYLITEYLDYLHDYHHQHQPRKH